MTDPKNQLHAAGSPTNTVVSPRRTDPKACSNAFGDNPVRVLVPLLEFNHWRSVTIERYERCQAISREVAGWRQPMLMVRSEIGPYRRLITALSRQKTVARHKPLLVYRLLNPLGFVAFKMGRRQGGPSRTGSRRAHILSDT
jgi:hypothetical protein